MSSNIDDLLSKYKDKWFTDKYWTTPYNWLPEIRSQFDLPERVQIHDATIREGQQTPGVAFRKEEQVRIAQALDELGVSRIEVIPMVSEEDAEATKEIMKIRPNAMVIAFSSWQKEAIDLSIDCGVDAVLIDYVGNPWQGKTFWNLQPDDIIRRGVEAITYAKERGVYVSALIWDDFRAPLSFLEKHYKAVVKEGHLDSVTIADTWGCSLPWTTLWMIKLLRSWIPDTPIEFHIHNDFGLATAGAIAAVCGGASVIQSTMCGIGERVGNVATEEIALALEVLLGVKTGIRLEKLYETARLVQEIAKFYVGPNKPVIGGNAFRVASGWIYWMINKARRAGTPQGMFPFLPELIGRKEVEFVISKGSGGSLIRDKLQELGVSLSEEELKKVVSMIKKEASIMKSTLSEYEILSIVERVKGEKK